MQIQAGTVTDAGMSDQPIDPLGERARTCLRMEMASPRVAECQKIVERLRSVKVRIMPATASHGLEVGFAPARLRLITMSAVTETSMPCNMPNTRKLSVKPCHRPMISMFSIMHK